jgi:hypothetical protein
LQKIYEKLNQKVLQIREEFKCQALLEKIKTQCLKSFSNKSKQGKMSLDQILEEEKHKAKYLLLKIENYMKINIPKSNSTNECLIDPNSVGYGQRKEQLQELLFAKMDIVKNDIEQESLKLQEAKEAKDEESKS